MLSILFIHNYVFHNLIANLRFFFRVNFRNNSIKFKLVMYKHIQFHYCYLIYLSIIPMEK